MRTCRGRTSLILPRLLMGLITLLLVAVTLPSYASPGPDKNVMELSLEQLLNVNVYGASKFPQTMTQAPSSVSIVTSNDIKRFGYRTLADILRSQRGFIVTYDRNYSYLGVRGFGRSGDYNGRILVLVDGHRLNENVFDSVGIGTDFILDVDLIDRVELIRGPSSSLYGSNAFFAVVNVLTRSGRDVKGLELSGEAGSYHTEKGRLTYGNQFAPQVDMILSATGFDSRGQNLYFPAFDDPATNNGVSHREDGDRSKSVFGKFSYRDFTLEGAYNTRRKDVPTAPYWTDFNTGLNRTTDSLGYIDLKYDRKIADDFGILARASYNAYDYKGQWPYSGVLNKDYGKGEWWAGEVTATKTLARVHKVTGGVEGQLNTKQDQGVYDVDPSFVYLDDTRTSNRWAIYAQDEFSILTNLVLNAGLRYDHYSTFGSTTNPRAALIYTPFDRATAKLLYGTAFRAPNAYELYYQGGGMKANSGLDPERITTWEAVWEQFLGENLHVTASGFYYRVSDSIRQVEMDDTTQFRNLGDVTGKGIELEAEAKWDSGIYARASYTYQDVRDEESRSWFVNSPKHIAKANLSVPLFHKKLYASAEGQYLSRRKTVPGRTLGGFTLVNVTLFSQQVVKDLEVSFSVYNLLDKKYADVASEEHVPDAIRQDGRNYRFKITYLW